uniref:NADH dehydrogenase subunit 4L n=1 Tax=Metrocoris acutus TaxID=2867915 RepID=UPI002E77BF50|nr:NADH dehydrogenase subunit 4L [Metrocoris acutus]WPW46979.1 NADH dehydrogenase subunit 4L [Metrocoris acutus]
MFMNIFILWYMYMCGMVVLCSLRKHLLLTLLILEYLAVVIFFSFFMFLNCYLSEYYFIIIFLTFSVCEGVLGLSVLISMIRCHGNDNLMNLSGLMW